MVENLLDLAAGKMGAAGIDSLAQALGIPIEKSQAALDTGLATVLAGMLNRASSKTGMGYLFNMISDAGELDLSSLSESFTEPEKFEAIQQNGAEMLKKVFGTRTEAAAELTATTLDGGSGNKLLNATVVLATSLLGEQVRLHKMDLSDLASLLIGQREFIRDKIPKGLLNVFDVPDFDKLGASLVTHGHAKPQEPRPEALRHSGKKRKPVSFSSWFFPLLVILVVLYALNMCMKKGKDEMAEQEPSMTPEESAFMESPSEPVGDSPLANGDAQADSGSDDFAGKLREYLKNSAREPNRQFPMQVNFQARTARIVNSSAPDIDALAKILQENPKITIAIEGHVKGQGDEIAEQETSQERADVVRGMLLQKGIAADRITAIGMGSARSEGEDMAGGVENPSLKNPQISVRVVTFQ
ncbi:OmpA family protein [Microbulbifer spongiae]|uniref:OmpA family protein n=1 Tax=Microbulbifer spongiae TaxID=2944933 RepID=A0ABY9EBV4_9GAMM|nr:OmpA family protein [Microbulbifer sp. MI-G]WKD49563.1 OmpA family protein [Microbulbifer sp. MI-G]